MLGKNPKNVLPNGGFHGDFPMVETVKKSPKKKLNPYLHQLLPGNSTFLCPFWDHENVTRTQRRCRNVTNPTFGIKFGHVESHGNPSEVVDLIWEPVENLTKDLHSLKQA